MRINRRSDVETPKIIVCFTGGTTYNGAEATEGAIVMLVFASESRRVQILDRFEDLPYSCLVHDGQTVVFVFDEAPLTAREGEVLWRVMLGEPHEKIAGSFGVSRKTITRTVARIRRKLSQSPEQSPWGLLSYSGESRPAAREIAEEQP